jgi:signal transduction histidine kinase
LVVEIRLKRLQFVVNYSHERRTELKSILLTLESTVPLHISGSSSLNRSNGSSSNKLNNDANAISFSSKDSKDVELISTMLLDRITDGLIDFR